MTLGQTLYHVLRATHDEYGDDPPDGSDRSDVSKYLETGGNTDFGVYVRVGRLSFRSFIQVNVDEQWANTQADLWLTIQIRTQTKQDDPPPDWGPEETLADMAQYIAFNP